MSVKSVLADVKHVLADLPTIRTTLVAALAAAGAVAALVPHSTGVGAAVVSGITAVGTFLADPKVIKIIADIAAAAANALR